MKTASSLAIAAAFLAGSAMLTAPAVAQKKKEAEAAEPAQRQLKLSKSEIAAVRPLDEAVVAKDWAAAAAALPAAQAGAQSADAKYYVASRQYSIGVGTKDDAATLAAVNAMIASGSAPATQLPQLYSVVAGAAYRAKDYDAAAAAFQKLAEIDPNNEEHTNNIATIRGQQKRYPEALAIMQQRIDAAKQAGGKASDNSYRQALQYTIDGKLAQQGNTLSREYITAYPTPENWKLALDIYRSNNPQLDNGSATDLLRLSRAAKVADANDYRELAENANEAGLPGEANAVLTDGYAAGLDRNKVKDLASVVTTKLQGDRASLASSEAKAGSAANGRLASNLADAYAGYGDYAKAVALYRTALSKGGVDANVVNTRLGIALAMSGDRAGADTAFTAVTGPRADIAALWKLWLSQRA